MSISEWWKQQRAARDAEAHKAITGVDPRTSAPTLEEHTVRMRVATELRQLFDAGADPMVLIQSYMVGAIWLADNNGVSRDKLIELVKLVELKRDRALIYKPGE